MSDAPAAGAVSRIRTRTPRRVEVAVVDSSSPVKPKLPSLIPPRSFSGNVSPAPCAQPASEGASVAASSLNLINNVVGAGLFSMPWAVRETSLVGGVVLCLVTCVANAWCYILLARCCDLCDASSYLQIGHKAFGPVVGTIAQLCALLYALVSCVSYAVLSADFLVGGGTGLLPTAPRSYVLIAVAVLIFFPLSLLRKTESLKWTSLVSTVATVFAAVLVAGACVLRPAGSGVPASAEVDWWPVKSPASSWGAVPIINVAFTAHYNAPRLYSELQSRTVERFSVVVGIALGFSVLVYVVTGVAGYIAFGESVKGSILLNFSVNWEMARLARGALALVVVFTFPLACHCVRESLLAFLTGGTVSADNASLPTLVSMTALIVVCATAAAIHFERLEVVLALKGALLGNAIVYCLPPLFYAKLLGSEAVRVTPSPPPHDMESPASVNEDLKALLGGICCDVVAIACSVPAKACGLCSGRQWWRWDLLLPVWGVAAGVMALVRLAA